MEEDYPQVNVDEASSDGEPTERFERAGLYICNECDHGVHLTVQRDPFGALSIPPCPVCGEGMSRQVPAHLQDV